MEPSSYWNSSLVCTRRDGGKLQADSTPGYTTHSLALVADAFHMLNDVLSLCVGLWAVNVANQKTQSKMYTYGVSNTPDPACIIC
jgi:Cation efflux family